MLIKEFYEIRYDGIKLYRTYSNEGFKIRQIATNIVYDEAIDVEDSSYTYEETNIPIEEPEEELYEED